MHTRFLLSENLKRGEHSEELGVGETIISKWILEKWGGKVWTGLIWLKIGTSGGLL
jgi:hypothetical protein